MTFWALLREALRGLPEPWDAEADEDVQWLREQAAAARASTRRLEIAFPLARSTRYRNGEVRDAD